MAAALLRRALAAVDPIAHFPPAVRCILAFEAAERLCYYGTRAVLATFMTTVLAFSEGAATSAVYYFLAASYASPFLGGYLADVVLGKFRTIAGLGCVYAAGLAVVVATAFAPGVLGSAGLAVGLVLMAAGVGGIKPCCAPFGTDQLGAMTVREEQSFFLLWYWSINAGVLIAYIVVPLVRSAAGFGPAFAVCLGALGLAAAAFAAPARSYTYVPPAGASVYARTCSVLWWSVRGGGGGGGGSGARAARPSAAERTPLIAGASGGGAASPDGPSRPLPPVSASADAAGGDTEGDPGPAPGRRARCCTLARARGHVAAADVADVRAFLRLVPIFACLPLFWAANDATDSIWVLQRSDMDMCLGPGACVPAESVGVLNPLLIVVLAPLFDRVLLPAGAAVARRGRAWAWADPTPLRRMALGMQLAAAAFAVTAAVQTRVDALAAVDGGPRLSVAWQLPMYGLMGVAEMLVSATGLEFAASQAPPSMRSSVIALFYGSVFVGDAVSGSLFAGLSGGASTAQLTALLGVLTSASGALFAVAAWRYTPPPARCAPPAGAGGTAAAAAAAAAALAAAAEVGAIELALTGGGGDGDAAKRLLGPLPSAAAPPAAG